MTEKISANVNMEQKRLNTLKSEHLNDGVRPIIACIGTLKDFYDEKGSVVEKIFKGPKDDITLEDVDYYGDRETLNRKNYKKPEELSYVISPVNGKDKISRSYKNCTGVVVSGADKETKENISFLSHQDPDYFLAEEKNTNMFFSDFKERISELRKKCVKGSIDAVIFGGNYFTDKKKQHGSKYGENYNKSIDFLSSGISELLGFDPTVIAGPKTESGADAVYFSNKNRCLYLVRPKVGDFGAESYLPKDIAEQEKKWQSDDQ